MAVHAALQAARPLPVVTEPPVPLAWHVAAQGADADAEERLRFGEGLIAEVAAALKRYARAAELGACGLVALAAVRRCQVQRALADDRMGRAYALRAVLGDALARLASADPPAAGLLEARYLRGRPLAAFEVEGYARATVLRHSRRAVEALAWALWELEQEARAEAQ